MRQSLRSGARASRGDENATTMLQIYQAKSCQRMQRLAQYRSANAQLRREIALRRKTIAGRQTACLDEIANVCHHARIETLR